MAIKQKSYKFTWHKNEKYCDLITRTTWVSTVGDQVNATNLFIRNFGTPKEITIERAEEYTKDGSQVFEPVIVKQNGHYIAIPAAL